MRRAIESLAAVAALAATAIPAAPQVPSDAWVGTRISVVAVALRPAPADPLAAANLEGAVRRAFAIYPGRSYDPQAIDFGVARVRGVSGVTGATVSVEFADGAGLRLTLAIDTTPPTSPRPKSFAERLTLVGGQSLVKLRVSYKGALALSGNQWFGNGPFITQYNPRGQFQGDNGPNAVVDAAPGLGMAAAFPLARGKHPVYVYGTFSYLGAASVGQDNNRSDARATSAWEEGYAGIVGGGVAASGSTWGYNVSYGMQPYCIGGGMLVCQIASSGGDRAADFAWPRWTGTGFLKAQFRFNSTEVTGFRFEANDMPSTGTVLAGVNVDHDSGSGVSLGGTWLTALDSRSAYYLPTGPSAMSRDGMRALHLRGAFTPTAGHDGPILKAEWARQTNANFDMAASGWSAESGWSFSTTAWRPSVSYRYSRTTGDDPGTSRYERWDLLYSGNDINTWVQGQLMKNIQYNSNVVVQRVMVRAQPRRTLRLTGQWSHYRADTANNAGGVLVAYADKALGNEALAVAERFLSRGVYFRVTAAALWPGRGVLLAVPDPVVKPWLVGIGQISLTF